MVGSFCMGKWQLHLRLLQKKKNLCIIIVNVLKGIVHFEINFWYVLAYLKGIQDVSVHSIFNFDIFWSNLSCLSVI